MLKDCSKIDVNVFAKSYFGRKAADKRNAVEWLSNLSRKSHGTNNILKFSKKTFDPEPIVYTDHSGQWWTGRYIGSLHFEGVSIEIYPRFGMQFIANTIPLSNFIPVDANIEYNSGDKFIHFLQAALWFNLLTKAAKHALPTVKNQITHIGTTARGKIDVRRTLKVQSKDRSSIASVSTHKETNNPISTIIALAFQEIQRWFPKHILINWLPVTIAQRLQQIIGATPRNARIPTLHEIQSSRLSSIARHYAPLAELSLDIINRRGLSELNSISTSNTLLLDVAELWEIFILDALIEALPAYTEITHESSREIDDYLLSDQSGDHKLGKLIPDYLVLENNIIKGIADAKYKRLGDAPWMSPKRDDLYQVTAYLSRFSDSSYADLYYPDWGETCAVSARNPWHLESGQSINFLTIPVEKAAAVAQMTQLHSSRLKA